MAALIPADLQTQIQDAKRAYSTATAKAVIDWDEIFKAESTLAALYSRVHDICVGRDDVVADAAFYAACHLRREAGVSAIHAALGGHPAGSYPYRLDAARDTSAAVVAEIHAELAESITRTEECPECGGDFEVDARGTYTTHLIAWDGKPCRNEK